MKRVAIAAVIGITLSSAGYASDPNELPPAGAQALLGGIVQERDVSLVFDYLRDALRATVEGREAPVLRPVLGKDPNDVALGTWAAS